MSRSRISSHGAPRFFSSILISATPPPVPRCKYSVAAAATNVPIGGRGIPRPGATTSVAEADSRESGGHHYVVGKIDAFFFLDYVLYGNRYENWRLQRKHLSPFRILYRRNRSSSKSCSEEPVVSRRHSATLKMPEHKQTAFF